MEMRGPPGAAKEQSGEKSRVGYYCPLEMHPLRAPLSSSVNRMGILAEDSYDSSSSASYVD